MPFIFSNRLKSHACTYHQSWRAIANGDHGKHHPLVVKPVGTACDWSNYWLYDCLTHNHVYTQSRMTGGATTHEWWYDHTRLVVRPCETCLRLVIADRSQTVLNMTVDLVATDFARTITHDHYDQWHVLFTIWQRFLHFSIVTWSHVWCDCGNRRHEQIL